MSDVSKTAAREAQAERLIDKMLGAQSRFTGLWTDDKPLTEIQLRLKQARDEARAKLMEMIRAG